MRLKILSVAIAMALTMEAREVKVVSPSGFLTAVVSDYPSLAVTIEKDGKPLMRVDSLSLSVKGQNAGQKPVIGSVKRYQNRENLQPLVSLKKSFIQNCYNEVLIRLGGSFALKVRVMDDAVAYRFVGSQRGQVEVTSEQFSLHPLVKVTTHRQTARSHNTSYEEPYQHAEGCSFEGLATLPVLLSGAGDLQMLVGESDVDDYPHAFLRAGNDELHPDFPHYPLEWEPWGDRSMKILREAPFIARTQGTREYPWRWVVVTDSKGLVEQTVPLQLSRKPVLSDISWIHPGKVSWEWWNGAVPYGPDIHFKAGNNYDTYAHFIDFAAEYGLEYILLDEGWALDTRNPFNGKTDLRLQELIAYGKSRGVGIVLWLPWLTVEQHFNLFATYEQWGVKGVKIDFMDRADQWMNGFYKRVVTEAARHHLFVDFHGAFTPSGLEYEYPNLLSYEGVRGLEQMGGCQPANSIWLPFIRNAVGAMDYTPGAMLSMQPELYRSERPNAASIGTRAYQLALYVVFESGIQMLADNPTLYRQNDLCTRFIASVPTTWDETRVLAAEAGKYIVVAKRKGNEWFLGGMNGEQQPRELTLSLNFLGKGTYRLQQFVDGPNANYQAMDYDIAENSVTASAQITLTMARNGGWAGKLIK